MKIDSICHFSWEIGQWIYDFQTLITGILAVAAAWYAVDASKRQANRERAAKLRAARASLPTALSSLCEYAQTCGQALNAAWPTAAKLYPNEHDGGVDQKIKAEMPDFPYDLLESLERVVELTDAEDVAERIESILREIQIFSARTRPLKNGDTISTDFLAIHIVQAAALHARAESLFTYARRKTTGVNSADLWDRTITALNIMQIYTPDVHKEAMSQKASGNPPGEADSIESE